MLFDAYLRACGLFDAPAVTSFVFRRHVHKMASIVLSQEDGGCGSGAPSPSPPTDPPAPLPEAGGGEGQRVCPTPPKRIRKAKVVPPKPPIVIPPAEHIDVGRPGSEWLYVCAEAAVAQRPSSGKRKRTAAGSGDRDAGGGPDDGHAAGDPSTLAAVPAVADDSLVAKDGGLEGSGVAGDSDRGGDGPHKAQCLGDESPALDAVAS